MLLRRAARAVPAACAAALLVALGGCTAGHGAVATDSGTERFVAGKGIASYVRPGHRKAVTGLAGEALDGSRLDVDAWRGDVVVVNVWGSWCAPCKAEQRMLERVATDTRPRGVRFVGIDVREPGRTPPRRHVAFYRVSYPSLWDPSSSLLTRFPVAARTIPTTYVLDRDGRIAGYVYGGATEQTLRALLDKVLA